MNCSYLIVGIQITNNQELLRLFTYIMYFKIYQGNNNSDVLNTSANTKKRKYNKFYEIDFHAQNIQYV